MGLTLDELELIYSTFKNLDIFPDQAKQVWKCEKLIEREIKLKIINPVTGKKIDVSGNSIFDGE